MKTAKIYLDEFIKKLSKFKLLSSSIIWILLSGCSSLTVTNAIPEIESPVYHGRKNSGFSFTSSAGKELNLIDDPSARPPDLNSAKLEVTNKFISKPEIHLYPKSRLSLTAGLQNSSVLFLGATISLLNGLIDDPAAGTIYAILNFTTTFEQARKSGNQKGLGGAGGYPWDATAQNFTCMGGFSIGYQTARRLVPFIGYNYQSIQTSGKIEQSAANGDSGGSYIIRTQMGLARVYGIGFEWRPKYGFFLTPQINYYEFNWGGNEIKEATGSIKITYVPVQ